VLVDKPGARNATEARRAFDAVHRSGVKASVGLTRHFEPAWLEARTLVAAGALGRVIGGEAFAVTSTVRVRDPANHLFDRDLSGHGILLWLGIHDVDGLLWLTGEAVAAVQAMVANAGGEEIGVEDAASVALRFRSGALATLHLANALPRPGLEGHVAIRGSLGSVTLTPDGRLHRTGPGSREDPLRAEERRYEKTDPGGYGPGALLQIRDFLDVIRTGGEPRVTGRDLVRALEVIDAAYESAATGRRVPVR